MPGKTLRRIAPAIALVFITTLLAGVPGVGAAVTPRGNDDIPARCGLNVALVLDRSGSISNSDAEEEVRDSGTAFINGLLGTGSKAALVTFATSASVNVAPTDNLASVASAINAIPDSQFSGATNWEDALLQAKNLNFGTVPLPKPADLVVIVTDGDPTTYINDNTDSGGSTSTDDLDKAITQANAIKALGSHMFAVGVTTAPTTSNLISISGPDQYPVPEASINKGDWTVVSIAGLEDAMRTIALELCDESVTVHKLIDGVPASDPWTFTATSEGTTPQVKATNNLGSTLPFEWESVQPVIATIVETPQAGYTLAGVNPVQCYQEDGTTVVPTSPVVNGATLTVGPRDKIDCYFSNVATMGTLTVTKVLSPANDSGKFNLRIDGATAGTGANVGNGGTTGAISVNTGSHSFAETAGTGADLANYTSSSACLANGQTVPINNGSVSVASNQNVVCTITNTRKTGSLTVTKDVQGGSGTFDFTVACDGLEPTNHAITGDGQFIVEGIPTETSCTVTEDDDPLFNSSVLPADGTVTIHSGDSAVVAFINSAKPDGITLDKKVNGQDHASIGDALLAHVGDTLTYTVVVTNNGQVPLTIDTLSDPVAAGFAAACPHLGSVLDVGDSFTCTYTVTATVDTKNVASVKGVDDLDRSVTASDSTYVDVIHPGVTVVKTANPTNPKVGETVTFSYVVTNTGDTVLTDLKVTDDVLLEVGTIASLAPGASTTLTKTMVVTATSKTINVGTVKGSDPLGLEIKASDDATITVVIPEVVVAGTDTPLVLGIELVAPAPAAPVVAPATLPRTGTDPSRLLLLGWIAFLAGLAALLAGSKIWRRGESLS